jgi:hypothetical protein
MFDEYTAHYGYVAVVMKIALAAFPGNVGNRAGRLTGLYPAPRQEK